MNINSINNIKFNNYNNHKDSGVKTNNRTLNLDLKSFYPANYTNYISFGAKTKKENLEHIREENFPNEEILNTYKQVIANNENRNLYHIHSEYYGDLLKCKTLDEAKEKYPEFKDVIDAKELDDPRPFSILNKIKRGEKEDLLIDDLSLKLLQNHYGNMVGIYANEKFYNITASSIRSLFMKLNIPEMNKQYLKVLQIDEPGYLEKRSELAKNNWRKAEKRSLMSETRKNSRIDKNSKETPTCLDSIRERVNYFSKYSETLTTAMKINTEFKNGFLSAVYNSKDFNLVSFKLQLEEPLDETDKDIINKFFADCQRSMKDYSWVLGEMRKEILTGLGFKLKENNDEN